MRTKETIAGYRFVETSNATTLRPGARVTNDEYTGMLLGFSIPRGFAIVNVGAGIEVLLHPEGLRAADVAVFDKVSVEELEA